MCYVRQSGLNMSLSIRCSMGAVHVLSWSSCCTSRITDQPHETNIIAEELFNATVGIDIAQIHIYQNPEHHAGMTGRTAFGRILAVKFFKMYLFNDTVNDPERIVPKIKSPGTEVKADYR